MRTLFKKFNTLYLWEKDNLWYDNLIQEYDDQSLLKLFFPEKSHLNKFRITPTDLISENNSKIQQFLDYYKKKKESDHGDHVLKSSEAKAIRFEKCQ